MKTAEEKATEFMKILEAYAPQLKIDTDRDILKSDIIRLLKEQDRDTRHACAESVMVIDQEIYGHISADKAYSACVNTKAV